MAYCSQCGKKKEDVNGRFCMYCGAEFDSAGVAVATLPIAPSAISEPPKVIERPIAPEPPKVIEPPIVPDPPTANEPNGGKPIGAVIAVAAVSLLVVLAAVVIGFVQVKGAAALPFVGRFFTSAVDGGYSEGADEYAQDTAPAQAAAAAEAVTPVTPITSGAAVTNDTGATAVTSDAGAAGVANAAGENAAIGESAATVNAPYDIEPEAAPAAVAVNDAVAAQAAPAEEPSIKTEFDIGAQRYITGMTASASSQLPKRNLKIGGYATYEPKNVLDSTGSTAWCENAPGAGIGEWIMLTFKNTETIIGLSIKSGNWRDKNYLAKNYRVKTATIEFSDGTSETIDLADPLELDFDKFSQLGGQVIFFDTAHETAYIKLYIDDVYMTGQDEDTLISDIDVIGK